MRLNVRRFWADPLIGGVEKRSLQLLRPPLLPPSSPSRHGEWSWRWKETISGLQPTISGNKHLPSPIMALRARSRASAKVKALGEGARAPPPRVLAARL